MSLRARVICLGQEAAGDDGVGLVVLASLRARGMPAGVELVHAREAAALVGLLETPAPVVLVDAVLARPPGRVVVLREAGLGVQSLQPVSSHGLGVGQAVALARLLAPEGRLPPLQVVAVTIAPPTALRRGLSPEVQAAVAPAVAHVLALLPDGAVPGAG